MKPHADPRLRATAAAIMADMELPPLDAPAILAAQYGRLLAGHLEECGRQSAAGRAEAVLRYAHRLTIGIVQLEAAGVYSAPTALEHIRAVLLASLRAGT